MRAVSSPAYRDFYYPLNVFMHVLTHEEGDVPYLHYGLFEHPEESIGVAQERSTAMLFERLPPPPSRLLEVGIGLGTTLARLTKSGYDAEGITPDDKQIAFVRARYGDSLRVHHAPLETFTGGPYDLLLFQESSQYIDSEAVFARARELAPRILVLDEFALRPLDDPGALRSLDGFLTTAERNRFSLTEDIDVSAKAAPTVQYFLDRLPRYRAMLIEDLSLSGDQIDSLITSGEKYRDRYADGTYGYRLMQFELSR